MRNPNGAPAFTGRERGSASSGEHDLSLARRSAPSVRAPEWLRSFGYEELPPLESTESPVNEDPFWDAPPKHPLSLPSPPPLEAPTRGRRRGATLLFITIVGFVGALLAVEVARLPVNVPGATALRRALR